MRERHDRKLESVAYIIVGCETDSRYVKSKKNRHLEGN